MAGAQRLGYQPSKRSLGGVDCASVGEGGTELSVGVVPNTPHPQARPLSSHQRHLAQQYAGNPWVLRGAHNVEGLGLDVSLKRGESVLPSENMMCG